MCGRLVLRIRACVLHIKLGIFTGVYSDEIITNLLLVIKYVLISVNTFCGG